MNKTNVTLIHQWLKGIGVFILIAIYLNMFIVKYFKQFSQTESHDTILYLVVTVSIFLLPSLFGNFLDFISLMLTNIVNNWESRSNNLKLQTLFSFCFSIILNTIAIQRIFTSSTAESFNIYFHLIQLRNVINYLLNLNFLSIILFSFMMTCICFYFLIDTIKFLKMIFNEYLILIVVSILMSIICWNLIDMDNGLYHLNVVLFPIVAINTSSPYVPIVSEGFISLYGGYFLWIGILIRLFGNTLFSVKIVLTILTILQIILYFVIIKILIEKRLIRIMVFVSGVFWSCYYGKIFLGDIYFQYFPLRTLLPSIFIVSSFSLYSNRFFQNIVVSNSFFKINLYDILLDFIVSIAILNNLDSSASVLVMYLFLYNWDFLKLGNYKIQSIVKQLSGLIINLTVVVVSFFLFFKLFSGEMPDLTVFTEVITKSQIFGLPFTDNLWMLFIVFYSFTLIQAFTSTRKEDTNARFRFSVAIYGLTCIFYFVNRSHPFNLLWVSLPFFLCCGFYIEQSFNSFISPEKIANYDLEINKFGFVNINIIRVLLSNWHDLLKLSFDGVFIMPFIMISLIAFLQFVPLTIYFARSPKNYSEIANIEALSKKVAILETKLNRPSILISDSSESYYYLFNNRKILYYPEYASIFGESFKPRFINAINTFNPIVTVCKLRINQINPDNSRDFYIQALYESKYQFQESEFGCDIFTKI